VKSHPGIAQALAGAALAVLGAGGIWHSAPVAVAAARAPDSARIAEIMQRLRDV
jgi:hypothetical protein